MKLRHLNAPTLDAVLKAKFTDLSAAMPDDSKAVAALVQDLTTFVDDVGDNNKTLRDRSAALLEAFRIASILSTRDNRLYGWRDRTGFGRNAWHEAMSLSKWVEDAVRLLKGLYKEPDGLFSALRDANKRLLITRINPATNRVVSGSTRALVGTGHTTHLVRLFENDWMIGTFTSRWVLQNPRAALSFTEQFASRNFPPVTSRFNERTIGGRTCWCFEYQEAVDGF